MSDKKIVSIRMTGKRRQLMFRVLDGLWDNQILLHYLWHFDRLRRCDEFLSWLIQHGYTGETLLDMIMYNKARHNMTPLNLAKWVQSQVDRVKTPDPIIAGRDYNASS